MRIRDWSSDVCSSDLDEERQRGQGPRRRCGPDRRRHGVADRPAGEQLHADQRDAQQRQPDPYAAAEQKEQHAEEDQGEKKIGRHTSELQSLMRISYAVFCLKKKTTKPTETNTTN